MPDFAVHYVFGQEVRSALPREEGNGLREAPYTAGLFGPDLWFIYHLWEHGHGRGRRMHTCRTGDFLVSLAEQARKQRDTEAGAQLFSYLAGFLCHYALDLTVHPYVIWETTHVCTRKRAHQAMERAMDVLEIRRRGDWGKAHPVTEKYYPRLKLPQEMRDGLDTAYEQVYGWKHAARDLDRCYRRYRLMYRWMEKPGGLMATLAKRSGKDAVKAFSHPETYYLDMDPENTAHREWRHPCRQEVVSTADFRTLCLEAKKEAVGMIDAAWQYIKEETPDEDRLRARFGNRSYLSGLDAEDPVNWSLPGLRPPE